MPTRLFLVTRSLWFPLEVGAKNGILANGEEDSRAARRKGIQSPAGWQAAHAGILTCGMVPLLTGSTRRHLYMRHGPPLDLSHPETSDASWGEETEAQRDTKVLQGWQLCRVHHALSSVDQWRHTAGPVYPRPSRCAPTTAHHPPVRGHLVRVHCAPGTI